MPFDGDPANYVGAVPAESAADLLVRAAHRLSVGWCQGTLAMPNGDVCAIGALYTIVTGNSDCLCTVTAWRRVGRHPRGVRAKKALLRAAQAQGFGSILEMNDKPGMTKARMVAALMEAASRALEDVP